MEASGNSWISFICVGHKWVMRQLCVSVCNKTLGEKLFLRNALFVFIRLSFQEKFQPC